MIPIVGMFRGLFLGSVLAWYSSSVWKTMDNYYNQEFKKYLQKEKQERRFPAEADVCRAVPEEPCASAPAAPAAATHDAVQDAAAAGGGDVEALGASTALESGTSGGGGEEGEGEGGDEGGGGDRSVGEDGGGCTVGRDVTHTGERRRQAEMSGAANAHLEDDGDMCPVLN